MDIDSDLLERLRNEARERGVSLKAYLNLVLREGLEASQRPAPGSYECPTYSMGEPRSRLDKALGLADALEDEEVARKLDLRK